MMNPDGFFVANMGDQWIEVSVTNNGNTQLTNVRAYIEGISDPGISRNAEVRNVGAVQPGASFTVRFLANFHDATPGIARVSVIVEADGHEFRRFLKKLFITRVEYHKPSRTYSVVMPEGTMRIVMHSAVMGPERYPCQDRDDSFVVLPQDVRPMVEDRSRDSRRALCPGRAALRLLQRWRTGRRQRLRFGHVRGDRSLRLMLYECVDLSPRQ
jgi:hypothetical protein